MAALANLRSAFVLQKFSSWGTISMAMKMEVMLRRMKFRDYYDIYCMLQEGYSIHNGMEKALNLSRHRLSSKNIVAMLLGGQFIPDNNFATLEPKYDVTKEQIREYVMQKLKE